MPVAVTVVTHALAASARCAPARRARALCVAYSAAKMIVCRAGGGKSGRGICGWRQRYRLQQKARQANARWRIHVAASARERTRRGGAVQSERSGSARARGETGAAGTGRKPIPSHHRHIRRTVVGTSIRWQAEQTRKQLTAGNTNVR